MDDTCGLLLGYASLDEAEGRGATGDGLGTAALRIDFCKYDRSEPAAVWENEELGYFEYTRLRFALALSRNRRNRLS